MAAWKPTIVSIELGMNDVNGGDDPAGYIKGDARPAREDPRHQGAAGAHLLQPGERRQPARALESDRCRRLDPYTNALKKLAEEEGVVFVDQYHPLLELWGKNNPQADAAARHRRARRAATQPAGKAAPKKAARPAASNSTATPSIPARSGSTRWPPPS